MCPVTKWLLYYLLRNDKIWEQWHFYWSFQPWSSKQRRKIVVHQPISHNRWRNLERWTHGWRNEYHYKCKKSKHCNITQRKIHLIHWPIVFANAVQRHLCCKKTKTISHIHALGPLKKFIEYVPYTEKGKYSKSLA